MIRQTLRDLPVGLVQTYERILLKISEFPLPRQEIALRAFKWTVCSRRPMSAEELQEAVAFDISDRSWDRDKIPDKDLMIETCRGLLVRDKEDGAVRFAHYTVQQYLLSVPAIGTLFQISPRSEAEAFVGGICVTYLDFSDFETQVALRTPNVQLEHLGVLKVGGPVSIPTVLGIGKWLLDIPYRLLGGKAKTAPLDIDYGKYLTPNRPKRPQAPSTLTKKYRLLEYVVEYWMDHTQVLELALNEKLRRLAMYKTLSFEFRPWGLNQHFGPYGCGACPDPTKAKELPFMSLFHYAAHAGHWSLMESLVTEYCQHEHPFDETILIACRQGKDLIVRNLMRKIKFDISDGRAINVAATAGQADILKYFLDPNELASSFNVSPTNASSLLNIAAINGHENVVDIIFNYCEGPKALYVNDVDKHTGRTALFSAVMNGHENVVRKLLAGGARTKTTETTAIHIAAEYGHQDILRILFKTATKNPDIHSLTRVNDSESDSETSDFILQDCLAVYDTEGDLPLHKAARNGYSAAVETILELNPTIIDMRMNGEVISDRHVHTGLAAVHLAAIGGHLSVLKILANSKARLKQRAYDLDWTALHFASVEGHRIVVEWLLENDTDFYTKTCEDIRALRVACDRGHEDIVRALLKKNFETLGFYPDGSELISLIESAALDRREAVLGTLLDCVGALGDEYLEEVIQMAEREYCHRALASLKSLLREQSWERDTDAKGWLATYRKKQETA